MEERQTWGTRAGFVLAAIGSAIGLGNIWRFPYVAYENGGGAFLIPYLFALLTAGIPLLIFEFTLGHKYRGSAPLAFRRMSEKWEWLGWWQVLVSFVIATYYSVIIAWAISYSKYAFTLEWGEDTGGFLFGTYLNLPDGSFWNPGGLQWHIVLPLLIVWLISFFILYRGVSRGIEWANKIFMPLLVVLVFIIMIRGITLPGAAQGLNHLFTPDWSKILDGKVWVAAYGQIFFSLSVAFAIMITYSSYLPKKSDINNNAFITAFANSGFSLLAALGVFGAIGYMANAQGVDVSEVAAGGVGLAFVVFPQIINEFPAMNGLFGFLFFLSLVVAGLSSLISIVNVVVQGAADKFGMSYKSAVVWIHIILGLISLLFATGSGLIYLDIADHFINNYGVALAGLVEVILLAWIARKIKEFNDYANPLSDFNVNYNYLIFCMGILTPVVLGIMMILNLIGDVTTPYGGYEGSLLFVFGWLVAILSIVIGFLFAAAKWPAGVNTSVSREEDA